MEHSLTITETAPTIASQTLMGMILPQTSLKHKNHNLIITETAPTIASQTLIGLDPITNEFKTQEP
ncbi:hypothetical protein HpNP83_05390 [Helicobacter pylori]